MCIGRSSMRGRARVPSNPGDLSARLRVRNRRSGAVRGHPLDGASAEEERRLAYVAMTRAREELVLTWAQTRGQYRQAPSRFLVEAAVARTQPAVGPRSS